MEQEYVTEKNVHVKITVSVINVLILMEIQLHLLLKDCLAGGLPLHWPNELKITFDGFETLSSAGSTLLIPDCELTTMQTSEAFYMKQICFTFLVQLHHSMRLH